MLSVYENSSCILLSARSAMLDAATSASEDARQCLWLQPPEHTRAYLHRVYGDTPGFDLLVATWSWRLVDVVWLDKLDKDTLTCIQRFRRADGTWTAHTASGFFLPPIGSKMEFPVIWQFREDRRCEGAQVEFGGQRAAPTASNASWIEVFHYFGDKTIVRESHQLWLYAARGSGVWFKAGRMISFSDTADLARHLGWNVETVYLRKGPLMEAAAARLGSEFDTIAFTHHVDAGFANLKKCAAPSVGWSSIYGYLHELVVISPHAQKAARVFARGTRRCPILPEMRAGWAGAQELPDAQLRSCTCDSSAFFPKWPHLAKDRKWQIPVMRCGAGRNQLREVHSDGLKGTLRGVRRVEHEVRALANTQNDAKRSITKPIVMPIARSLSSAAVDEFGQRFISSAGLPIRLLECGFGSDVRHWWKMHGIRTRPRDDSYLRACVDSELAPTGKMWSHGRTVGSVLRFDIPFAIFAGGAWPSDQGKLRTGVGWIFRELPPNVRHSAFAHDSRRDAIQSRVTRPSCYKTHRKPAEYAVTRFNQTWLLPCAERDKGGKLPFVNDPRMGCQHWPSDRVQHVFDDQLAYCAHAATAQGRANFFRPPCGDLCSNYNQVHFYRWEARDIAAVFYVNVSLDHDSIQSLRAQGYANISDQGLRRQAVLAAGRGWQTAHRVATMVRHHTNRSPPIVQLHATSELCDPRPSVLRRKSRLHAMSVAESPDGRPSTSFLEERDRFVREDWPAFLGG